MMPRGYWRAAREARYTLLFALPLLLLYEGLSFALTRSSYAGLRNGADVLLKTLFVALGGSRGVAVFSLALVGVGAWLVWRDRKRHPGPLDRRVFGFMMAESVVYAMLLGSVVSALTSLLLSPMLSVVQATAPVRISLTGQLVLSLGAGIYEELLFRVLLVSGLLALARRLGWRRPVAVGTAIVGAALIFSAFHYIGPMGDTFTLASFTFRAIAGLMLSGLYVARGFGIAAWTHALYDVGLTLLG
ncbi:MAG: CPBP family intramembrane metalloprotease [Gemmatimonadota bacterium]|nr:CPBP family intramembrane metalloprotease [Gemmatimonadota bacterium]